MIYRTNRTELESTRIRWQGTIQSVQCRAWVWRYKLDNRTHHHLGFNLWVKGETDDRSGKFCVAISDKQQQKIEFRIGDEVKGTAWPCINAKHDIADYYRAGGFKVLNRAEERISPNRPPFTGPVPALDIYSDRGARMLDSKRWSKKCFTCIWANKSAVEIEYDFGKVKRYRRETFCYGPKSCPQYEMGEPRPVHYIGMFPCMDEGWMDDLCTSGRGEDDWEPWGWGKLS
ncbi:MAG: hypothetical protein JXA30_03995 [Deltaproteobacteria bacterium]|nr:hypothetical protein [Deltaproteobacteria bacterium]